MRDMTEQEQKLYNEYINKISVKTGLNLFDILKEKDGASKAESERAGMDKQKEIDGFIKSIGNLRTKDQAQAFQDAVNGSIITIAKDGDITFHNCGGRTMTNFERMSDKAREIENQLDGIRSEIKNIAEAGIILSENLGIIVSDLYDLMSALDELNEMEAENG